MKGRERQAFELVDNTSEFALHTFFFFDDLRGGKHCTHFLY